MRKLQKRTVLSNAPKISFYDTNHITIRTKVGTYFQSYNSVVALRDTNGNIYLGIDWDYSRTTMKFLSRWLNNMNAKEIRANLESGKYTYIEEME